MECFNFQLLSVEEERNKEGIYYIMLVYRLVATIKIQQVLSVCLFLKGDCFLRKMSE